MSVSDPVGHFVPRTPLLGSSLGNLIRILNDNRFGVSPGYIPRILGCALLSSQAMPFRVVEKLRYDSSIWDTEIGKTPLFILGHWRCGTTLLHNCISQDEQFGYFTTFQAMFPHLFLTGSRFFEPLVSRILPKKRPMDDATMATDLPQEEEYAIAACSPYSYYHGWAFPQNVNRYRRFVCMQDVSDTTLRAWKSLYTYLLKKVTLSCSGRRLVLKSPTNTGRVRLLLEMFPDAKFIHIYRNPYHVYHSLKKLVRAVLPLFCLQNPRGDEFFATATNDTYVDLYESFFGARSAIPGQNLVEIAYEDLIADPLGTLRWIYDALRLDGFGVARPRFRAYLETQKNVRGGIYTIDDVTRSSVPSRWGFVFDEYGYER